MLEELQALPGEFGRDAAAHRVEDLERERRSLHLDDELVGRDDLVRAPRAEFVDVGGLVERRFERRIRSLPRAVRVRLVEEVRPELLPAALDVVEQGQDVVLPDDRLARVGAAEQLHLVAVELPHLGRHGDEPGAEPSGAAGRHLAAATEHQAGAARPIEAAASPAPCRPRNSNGSPVNAARRVSIVSVSRAARSDDGTPYISNSLGT